MEKQAEKSENILQIKNLTIHYETDSAVIEAVNDVSFNIRRGEMMGLVGETGAGKTSIALATMKLLPHPPAHVISGEIILNGENLIKKSSKDMRKIRGRVISMIFQDPMTALNPSETIGDQIAEVIRLHQKIPKKKIMERTIATLEMVGIPGERYSDYPHQFSGGMKQRIIIAMALACEPDLIIADEPTTALDVTIQAQILNLIRDLHAIMNTSMLLITHDLGIVAEICDRCAVIYAGEIVEMASVEDLFDHPLHPYTQGLFRSLPMLHRHVDRLTPIPGKVVDPSALPAWCSFYDRCDQCQELCKSGNPNLHEITPGHFVRCFQSYERKEENYNGAD